LCRSAPEWAANRIQELEKLAYIGEHHFPDLTWKARCAEINADLLRVIMLPQSQCTDLTLLDQVKCLEEERRRMLTIVERWLLKMGGQEEAK
jgi:hypothetical protein